MAFKVSLDSSVIISHLVGDSHKDRDFLRSFSSLEVLTPKGLVEKYGT